jgi:Arc/MetJ-type ribon-helix-helix transcriptional regulator
MGNDLSTPMLQYGFPGLVPGDRWWVTAVNWLRAHHDGAAAYVVLVSSSSGLWRSCPWRHSKSTPSMYRPVPVASKVIAFVTPVSVRGRRSPVGRSDVIHDLGIAVRARGSIRIPNGYHIGMSRQIAVRLPDHLVEFVDQLVGEGRAASRAAFVSSALEREQRRQIAARDAAILITGGDDPDMNSLAQHVASMLAVD